MIDSIINFIQRNPLTTIIIVMLLVFAPSTFGVLLGVIAIVLLLLMAIPLYLLYRVRRASRKIEDEARQSGAGGYTYSQRSYDYTRRGASQEGDVKVYSTTEQPPKRVSDSVGDYVDFEEVKQEK
ncbi:MAG: DUF4834 family protein [Rikenellaceae bacterium]|nr:DUF4834 family protein [Rikenellaceae bacterium]